MLPKFIEDCKVDCYWTERQIQRDALGSVHTARVAQQRLQANCLQMILKKQWPLNSPNFNALQISCLESDTRRFYESFIRSQIQFLN